MAMHTHSPRYNSDYAWHYGDGFTCVGTVGLRADMWLYKLGIPVHSRADGATVIPYIVGENGNVIATGPEQRVKTRSGGTFWAEFDEPVKVNNLPVPHYVGYWTGGGGVVSFGVTEKIESEGWTTQPGMVSRIGRPPGEFSRPREVVGPAFGFEFSDTPPNRAPREIYFDLPGQDDALYTRTPLITWKYVEPERDDVVAFLLELFDSRYRRLIHSSGWVNSLESRYRIPAGVIRRDGRYQVRVTLKDQYGKVSENPDATRRQFYVDTTPPVIGEVSAPYSVKGFLCRVWVRDVRDDMSGVDSVVVEPRNPYGIAHPQIVAKRAGNSSNFYCDFDGMAGDGLWTFEASAFDRSGNQSAPVTVSVHRDSSTPDSPKVTISNDKWTNQNVVATVEAGMDLGSGVDRVEWRTGPDERWTKYEGPVTLKKRCVFYARTVDRAENASNATIVNVLIDKEPPEAPFIETNATDWFKVGSASVSITPRSDVGDPSFQGVSGISYTEYYIDHPTGRVWTRLGGTRTLTIGYTAVVKARSVDVAGNVSAESSVLVKVDGFPPTTPTISLSRVGWTTDPVVVTITPGVDTDSGVASTEYRLNDGVWKRYRAPFTVKRACKIYSRSTDRAGNVSPTRLEVALVWDGKMSLQEIIAVADELGVKLGDSSSLSSLKAEGYGPAMSLGDLLFWISKN